MDNSIEVKTNNGAVELYTHKIFELADSYFNGLTEKQQGNLYNYFPAMILHIKDSVGKIDHDDADFLNQIWNVYVRLCCNFAQIPTLSLFAKLIGLDRQTLHDWQIGRFRKNTRHGEYVKQWKSECESLAEYRLTNSEKPNVNLIFTLKANYGWRENPIDAPRDDNNRVISTLPDLTEFVESDDTSVGAPTQVYTP